MNSGKEKNLEGKNLPEEIWKTISEYPNYEVSSAGRIRNKQNERYLRHYCNKQLKQAYPFVRIYNENGGMTFYIHKLVMEAFSREECRCSACGAKKEVNHIDGNKLNNSFTNLEYLTRQENNDHSREKQRTKQREWWKNKNIKF